MPLYEGGDGKLYYNFAQGLKVYMHGSDCDKNDEYTLEIVGCHYIGITEYYDVERDGVRLPQPLSANRVKYLVSRYGQKTLAYGERLELPLLLDEVKLFYEVQERRRENAKTMASKLSEYVALDIAARSLSCKIGYAQAFGDKDEANALINQQKLLRLKANTVLTDNGIDPTEIKDLPKCEKCDGKGYYFNNICDCAIVRTAEIKAFNAEERRKLLKLTANNKKLNQ